MIFVCVIFAKYKKDILDILNILYNGNIKKNCTNTNNNYDHYHKVRIHNN